MDDEFSPYQSLGALRITNPDESVSPAEASPRPQEPSRDPPSRETPSNSHAPSLSSLPVTLSDRAPLEGPYPRSPPQPALEQHYEQPFDPRFNQRAQYCKSFAPSPAPETVAYTRSRSQSRHSHFGGASPQLNQHARMVQGSSSQPEYDYKMPLRSKSTMFTSPPRYPSPRLYTPPYNACPPSPPESHARQYDLASHQPDPMQRGYSPNFRSPTRACSTIGQPVPPLSQNSQKWRDKGAAIGVRETVDANGEKTVRYLKKGVEDFIFTYTLGEGSYSTVIAATDRSNSREYAVKVLDKRHIIKEKKVKYVNIEKDTLNRLTQHPGVVRLYYTFQDERSLYFVLDLASNGELLGILKKVGSFDEEATRFYGAQILDTVEYMHNRDVIHRDLKPENVLLDRRMNVKITDFGTAKILNPRPGERSGQDREKERSSNHPNGSGEPVNDDRASSFVGTAEYVSPELLNDKTACKASDLWAFGCIIYQLLVGRPPFKAPNEYLTFQKIVALEYSFPPEISPVAKDLIMKLLVLDPSQRLPIEDIKKHQFFRDTTWGQQLWKQGPPTLVRPFMTR